MLDVRDTAVSPDHNLLAYSADMRLEAPETVVISLS